MGIIERVVVQDASGYTTEVGKGVEVAAAEGGQVGSEHKLNVEGRGPAEHHDEGPNLAAVAIRVR